MKCPTCKKDCIIPAQKLLDEIYNMYIACPFCPKDEKFNKNIPFNNDIGINTGRCKKCHKRHIDYVIGNVLTILKKQAVFSENSALRDIGTPMITYGYQIPYPPRLGKDSLILIMDTITKQVAEKIVSDVPEIKAIIKRTAPKSKSIGITDTDKNPITYKLLSGCDIRCDIVSSVFGDLCIYKNQSLIHIEFHNTKIKKINELYLKGKIYKSTILDAFCGPGTLGLLCILGGAKKVILNDAWLPAIYNTILNLKLNSEILGIKIDFENKENENLIANQPILMARFDGLTEVLVYHSDIRFIHKVVENCDISIIDTFPSIDASKYIEFCRDFSKNIVII